MSKSETTGKPPKKRKKRRWLRWTFILLIVAALVYVGLRLFSFLQKADMSLGLSRVPGVSLESMLVNQQDFTPPADGQLRPAQIHAALRVITAIDTLEDKDLTRFTWRQRVSGLMNDHMLTRSHYTWIRSTLIRSIEQRPSTSADSVNVELLEMYESQFKEHWRVIEDTLDEELLVE